MALNLAVWTLTLVIPALFAWQLFGKKSHPEHDNRGFLIGAATLFLLGTVILRGIGSSASGPLYYTHLALSAPYFMLIPVILWTGRKLRAGARPHLWRKVHFGAIFGASTFFLISVGFGIGSYLQTRGLSL